MAKPHLLIHIASLLLTLTGNSLAMSNNTDDTKFIWLATESAPRHYPMEIIRGTFYYRGEDSGLYIPYGGTLKSGWGKGISNHHVVDRPISLPDRLKITYFSYAEKQFYSGEFDLPYEKILALFRDGVENPRVFPNGQTMVVYSKMMVGIAPGGEVAVWVTGSKRVEVFFGQAEKVELDPNAAFRLPFKSQQDADEYMAEGLSEALRPEELESLKKDGIPFGLWSRYRKHYDWAPTAIAGDGLQQLDVSYLNGEYVGPWNFSDKKETASRLPVPSKMSFISIDRTIYIITFDEFEIMDAFEKLGTKGQKVIMEFEPRLPRTDIKIRLYNDKESIELKKFVSDDW